MVPIKLRGMTWNHRRAIDPLVNTLPPFTIQQPTIEVDWASRPLYGFEFTPVSELAQQFDLIVLDHPFVGDIAASRCLLPLDGIAGPQPEPLFVGASLESYVYDGHLWAIPIDAACQVCVARPDLLAQLEAQVPSNWSEVLVLGHRVQRHGLRLAIGLKGVHSLMTLFTLCANLGRPCATDRSGELVDRETAREALALMRELMVLCDPRSLDWSSIDLHEAMSARDDLIFCPAVYCYATYAESDQRKPLRFHDLPGPKGHHGSTIGGTGLGISSQCPYRDEALAYAKYLSEAKTQYAFAHHHGQPARREVWTDQAINDRFGGCYSDTLLTIDSAWIRPRYSGYLSFQWKAGSLVERHLRGELDESGLIDKLQFLHESA